MLNPSLRSLCALLILFVISSAAEATLYRWKDSDGKLHMESTIPPEAAIQGYEILNNKGRVIEVIRPLEELEKIKAQQAAEKASQEQAENLRKEREKRAAIIDKYQNVDAIKLTRNGKITHINDFRDAKKYYILRKQSKLEKLQKQAEQSEQDKKPIQLSLLRDIDNLRKQIISAVTEMVIMENEKQTTWNYYTDELQQYAKVKGVQVEAEDEEAIKKKLSVSSDSIYTCKSTADCQTAWNHAKTFARQNATRRVQISGKDFIITARAVEPADISIAVMLVDPEHKASLRDGKTRIYMGLLCANSPDGLELCASDKIKQMHHSFLPIVSGKQTTTDPAAVAN